MLSGNYKYRIGVIVLIGIFLIGAFAVAYPLSQGQGIALGTVNEPGLLAKAEILKARANMYQEFGQMWATAGPAAIQIGAAIFAILGGIGIAYILFGIGYNIQAYGKIRLLEAERMHTLVQRQNLLAPSPHSSPPAISRNINRPSNQRSDHGNPGMGKPRGKSGNSRSGRGHRFDKPKRD